MFFFFLLLVWRIIFFFVAQALQLLAVCISNTNSSCSKDSSNISRRNSHGCLYRPQIQVVGLCSAVIEPQSYSLKENAFLLCMCVLRPNVASFNSFCDQNSWYTENTSYFSCRNWNKIFSVIIYVCSDFNVYEEPQSDSDFIFPPCARCLFPDQLCVLIPHQLLIICSINSLLIVVLCFQSVYKNLSELLHKPERQMSVKLWHQNSTSN